MNWIINCAEEEGLSFRHKCKLQGDEHLYEIRDSLGEMIMGLYSWIPYFGRRCYRRIQPKRKETKEECIDAVCIVIDKTVIQRWQTLKKYRPKNILEWAKEKNVDLDNIVPCDLSALTGKPIKKDS